MRAIKPSQLDFGHFPEHMAAFEPTTRVSVEILLKEVRHSCTGLQLTLDTLFCQNWSGLELVASAGGSAGRQAISVEKLFEPAPWFEYALRELYGYAVEGRWLTFEDHYYMDLCGFCRLVDGLDTYGYVRPLALQKTVVMAALRARLDAFTLGHHPDQVWMLDPQSDSFTLFEIAVLAQMDEKSVRNATHAGKQDRLETVHAGSRTLVTPTAALHWLKGRRGFNPTVLPDQLRPTGGAE